ncbi:hypothetical protein HN695_05230 [Candidatus Woesearchaeota archaeon]|jgi:hypothetical protein|nr:hypothetical protein [Candidatus Woesearchaeota archaeon]MBT5272534.1 hypothetical protein [Candidatus Woesearchaeota archaeon]MBT6041458.1 hypothetical protein [Candidatus Woesearchaeota archaeon]MBT6336396.1 hypothetical protein [Candidatus Woesearchaeota archaeon]MBT7927717.1 hypothetical protein [Candidatus Woesearchaeota archaeon]
MKKIILYVFVLLAFLLVSCSPSPRPNIEGFLSIEDLTELQGIQHCSWDSQGDSSLGIFASKGIFDIDNGNYYFENEADGFGGPKIKYVYYDGLHHYNWINITVPGRPLKVLKISPDKLVLNNLELKVWFNLHHDFDYGFICQEVASVTLQTFPSDATILEV